MNNKKFIDELTAVSQARHEQKTVDTYLQRINAFSNYYPNKDLYEITAEDINEYLIYVKKTLKYQPASIKSARDILHFVYNVHLKQNFIIDKYTINWSSRKLVEVPSQNELLSIFKEIENETIKTALEFIYGTGIDLAEMLRVKVKDIDFNKDLVRITLNRKKGHRKAILPQKLRSKLLIICSEKTKNSFVFSNKQGIPFHQSSIAKAFRKAVNKYDSNLNYTSRSLRHAYIKHLEYNDISLKSIFEHLKLSEVVSLEFYSRIGVKKTEVNFSPLDIKMTEDTSHPKTEQYISLNRITELESVKCKVYDFKKLCQLLRELNMAHNQNQLLTIPMIIRSIINHIPPIFGCSNFTEIANNHSGNSKSFKKSMLHLDTQLKNIAEIYLHQQIRKKEELPESQQVDFRSPLDLLLQEILTIVK